MLILWLCSPFCFLTPFRTGGTPKHDKYQPANMSLAAPSVQFIDFIFWFSQGLLTETVLLHNQCIDHELRTTSPSRSAPKSSYPSASNSLSRAKAQAYGLMLSRKRGKDKKGSKILQCNSRTKTSSWKQQKNSHPYHSKLNKEKWQTVRATWILPGALCFAREQRQPQTSRTVLQKVSPGFSLTTVSVAEVTLWYKVSASWQNCFTAPNENLLLSEENKPAVDSSAIEGYQHKMLCF